MEISKGEYQFIIESLHFVWCLFAPIWILSSAIECMHSTEILPMGGDLSTNATEFKHSTKILPMGGDEHYRGS